LAFALTACFTGTALAFTVLANVGVLLVERVSVLASIGSIVKVGVIDTMVWTGKGF